MPRKPMPLPVPSLEPAPKPDSPVKPLAQRYVSALVIPHRWKLKPESETERFCRVCFLSQVMTGGDWPKCEPCPRKKPSP